ncbi:ribonuclease [Paraburkholderia dilworthii]|uniref:ribonuclease n=1 Tax=Paraburkholderia dilworthii TaxID=948106 RepID=UPI0003FBA29A|nr:ribonuclease [Paraburkholderia dilworthii]
MARRWQRIKGVLIGAVALCAFCGAVPQAVARNYTAPAGTNAQAQGTVAAAQLPREAVNTLNLIAAGGPYPYEKDGVVFGNRERLLPPNRRGYYHEYTVPTPRSRNRGARRIVCGGPLKRTDNCYYSDDHYTSFNRIVE